MLCLRRRRASAPSALRYSNGNKRCIAEAVDSVAFQVEGITSRPNIFFSLGVMEPQLLEATLFQLEQTLHSRSRRFCCLKIEGTV
jgi:hypothetical protein